MPIDPRHGRFVPAGRDVARLLRMLYRRIGDDIVGRIAAGRGVDLAGWLPVMVQTLTPLMARYYLRGHHTARVRIYQAQAERRAREINKAIRGVVTKTGTPDPARGGAPVAIGADPLFGAFDVLLPQVKLTIGTMVFQFALTTLRTAESDAAAAYGAFREQLMAGVERGEALKDLTARTLRIFRDPVRAQRVAMTETSRAMHRGQVQAARESGIVSRVKWLASSDACEHCLQLDGKEVPIGQPFYVNPKGGPYAVVEAPPLHPHCMCAIEEVIE